MKTIVISGAHSNVGKTSLAEEMLRNLPRWSALKVTVKKGLMCPRNNSCRICSKIKRNFDIVTDRKIINQRNTDTSRLKKAGAEKVVWLKTTLKGLKAGLKKALYELKGAEGVIIEGTSALRYIKPNLAVYLEDNAEPLNTSAKEARRKADIIIDINK